MLFRSQIDTWAAKEKVDVSVDFITSSGWKINLTAAAEYQARSGHDVMQIYNWDLGSYASRLEPVDDVIKELQTKYGTHGRVSEYLAKVDGAWRGVPNATGTLNLTTCGRISMLKQYAGIDIQAMYPAGPADPKASEGWTYDTFLKAAEACHKAGYPFGLGLGSTADSVNNTGIIFSAFGAELVNAKGEITVD